MPLGQKAINLRELLHFLRKVDESVLYYHLVQSRLTVTISAKPPWWSFQESPANTLKDFCQGLNKVGLDSVYYHFFEARRRLGMPQMDDFSYWVETNFGLPELVEAIRDIDGYFYTLKEIRDTLLRLIHQHLGDLCGYTE